jgi:Flp pilus assembly protein TadD
MLPHLLILAGAVGLSALVVTFPGRSVLTPEQRTEVGVAYLKLGLDGAERTLRTALASRPQHLRARLALGMALTQQGRHEEAIAELEAARVAAGKDDREPALALAVAQHLSGRTDAARALLETLRGRHPEDGRPSFNLALLAIKRGDKAAARVLMQEALTKELLTDQQRRDAKVTLGELDAELAGAGQRRGKK